MDEIRKTQEFFLVDVGARGGTKQPWDAFESQIAIVGFEPEKREYDRLAKEAGPAAGGGRRIYLDRALWREPGKVPFHVTAGAGKSSIYEPNLEVLSKFTDPGRFSVTQKMEVEAVRLEDIVAQRGLGADFIKLDCQGADYEILRGAGSLLGRAVMGVEVEVLFEEIYKGSPRFHHVDAFMRENGFQLYDLRTASWKRNGAKELGYAKGKLIFADALYLREEGWKGIDCREALLKVMFCHCIYGYFDSSYAILRKHGPEFLEASLLRELEEEHSRFGRSVVPGKFPGRRRLARWAALVAKALAKPGEAAANIGTSLGNRLE